MTTKSKPTPTFTVKWMLALFTACYSDVACASDITPEDAEFDLKTVKSRLAKEGASFLTKALPLLGKQLDKLLSRPETEGLPLAPFPGWKTNPMSKLPRFLGGLFRSVLAPDGSVLGCGASDPDALGRLRQLLYLFYKVEFPSTDEQNRETIDSFLHTDAALPLPNTPEIYFASFQEEVSSVLGNMRRSWILAQARRIIARVLAGENPTDPTKLIPRHGPGSVATGEKAHMKPVFKRYYTHLHAVFPYDIYMSYNLSSINDDWMGWQDLEELRESTAKVVLVPKDSRGPRLISCEPLEIQWIQQALMTRLVDILESHPLTRGRVNFKRQEINRELAFAGSLGLNSDYSLPLGKGDKWVTMDMKDASDRVSLNLVQYLFPTPWVEALEAVRSSSTKLPNGNIVQLRKYAPMGSAVCFPVEAFVFWAICVATQQHVDSDGDLGCGISRKAWYADLYDQAKHPKIPRSMIDAPFVYGDDLIVKARYYELIEAALESVHLKVNKDKCCRGDWFRESCGMDAFQGVDVTPLKIRKPLGYRSRTALFSWCEYHNWFSRHGYDNAARWIRQYLTASKDAQWIVVLDEYWLTDAPGYAYLHVAGEKPHALKGKLKTRFNKETHRLEFLGWGATSCLKQHHVPGWSEMLRMASHRGRQLLRPSVKEGDRLLTDALTKHLEATAYEYADARSVVRKRAWYPALLR